MARKFFSPHMGLFLLREYWNQDRRDGAKDGGNDDDFKNCVDDFHSYFSDSLFDQLCLK